MNIFLKNVIKQTRNYLSTTLDKLGELFQALIGTGTVSQATIDYIDDLKRKEKTVLDYILIFFFEIIRIKRAVLDLFDITCEGTCSETESFNNTTYDCSLYKTIDGFAIPIWSYVNISNVNIDATLSGYANGGLSNSRPSTVYINTIRIHIKYLGQDIVSIEIIPSQVGSNNMQLLQNNNTFKLQNISIAGLSGAHPDELEIYLEKLRYGQNQIFAQNNSNQYYNELYISDLSISFNYRIAGFISKLHDGTNFNSLFTFFSTWSGSII